MKSLLFGVVSLSALLTGLVQADEKSVQKLLEERFPGIMLDGIQKTPFLDLYEVDMNGGLIYTDEKVSFLFQGNLFDAKTKHNLTQERMAKLSAIPFNTLPFDQAIKIVKGNGKRQLVIFEDPKCPFCKQLEGEMTKVDNVTVYVFLYPLESIHPGATELSRKIWCAPDRSKAWLDAMQSGTVPVNKADCDTPVDKLAKLGSSFRITGTPTLVFADGTRFPGALPADRLEKLLDGAMPK